MNTSSRVSPPENAIETLRALLAGFSADFDGAEIVLRSQRALDLEALEGRLESIQNEKSWGLGLRLSRGGRIGHSATTQLDRDSLSELIARSLLLLKNAPVSGAVAQLEPLVFEGDASSGDFSDPTFDQIALEEKSNRVLNLESNVLRFDARVHKAERCRYAERLSDEWLWTHGSRRVLHSRRSRATIAATAVAKTENGEVETGSDSLSESHYYDLDWTLVPRNAATLAVKLLGARKIPGGSYPLLLSSLVTPSLLHLLSSALCGDNVAQKASFLRPQDLGQELFSPVLTLADDPHQRKRLGACFWDAEGTPTRRLTLIERGRLHSFAHDRASAEQLKAGGSTGHSVRASERQSPRVGFHNLVLEPGAKDFVDLLREMGRGLLVQRVVGLHTVSRATGEFSLSVQGQWVEGGAEAHPVSGMVWAGRLQDLFRLVTASSRDLRFSANGMAAPSLLCLDQRLSS